MKREFWEIINGNEQINTKEIFNISKKLKKEIKKVCKLLGDVYKVEEKTNYLRDKINKKGRC